MDYDVRSLGQCGSACQVGKKKHKPRKPKASRPWEDVSWSAGHLRGKVCL